MSPMDLHNRRVLIDYTNYRGERSTRPIRPLELFFGVSEHHPQRQWLLRAWDVDKHDHRTFAMKDIHRWIVEAQP